MRNSEVNQRDKFERTALRITGFSFYLLAGDLIFGSVLNIINDAKPETTLVRIIVSTISIFTMYYLVNAK